MDYRILCSIRGLQLQGMQDYKTDKFILCNNDEFRKELFHSDDFNKKIGAINYTFPFDGKAFGVALIQATPEMLSWNKAEIANKLTEQTIFVGQHLRDFLHFLWFVKDCGIAPVLNIGVVHDKELLFYFSEISYTTNRYGESNDVYFSKSDLDMAGEFLAKYISVCPGKPIEIDESLLIQSTDEVKPHSSIHKITPNPKENVVNYRITRAWTFLLKSRMTHVLPMKIAFTIPVLECLFSTDANEVTQKVSERAAFYIGKDNTERQGIFDIIKDVYSLRSKYFHGQKLQSKHESIDNQKLLSLSMDCLLRRIFTKAILEDSALFNELDQNKFDKDMSSIIFK